MFHCTTEECIAEIFEKGKLEPRGRDTVSFTEVPIGELDRMKYRHHESHQVAIGFPRRYIESLGLTPVWYLKHNPRLRQVLSELKVQNSERYAEMSTFIDETDDVSPFQEIRTRGPVAIADAVWILTTNRTGDSTRPLVVPGIEKFQAEHGWIPRSYWQRSHQLDILSEWQFTTLKKNEAGVLEDFRLIGEHYWKQRITEEKPLRVTLQVHQKQIIFEVTRMANRNEYEGPWRFLDVARLIVKALVKNGESSDTVLPHRLIKDVGSM